MGAMPHHLVLKPENHPQPVLFIHRNVACVSLGLDFQLSPIKTSLLPGRTMLISVDEDHAHGAHSFKNETHKYGNDVFSLSCGKLYLWPLRHTTALPFQNPRGTIKKKTENYSECIEQLWFYNKGDGIAPNSIKNAFQGLLHIHLKGENKI